MANDLIEEFDRAFPSLMNLIYTKSDIAQRAYSYLLSQNIFDIPEKISENAKKIIDETARNKEDYRELKDTENAYKEFNSHLSEDLQKEYNQCVAETETEKDAEEDFANGTMVYT